MESTDARPVAGALFYLACVIHGADKTRKDVRDILKPLTASALDRKIKSMQLFLNL